MNSIELYFTDGETAYQAFSMQADGKSLMSHLKKSMAYDELEDKGLIERGYWRIKSRYKNV